MRLPVLEWIRSYPARYLGADVMAGVVVAALAMPQSLGYAGIAGVPVLVGLYSIPLALIAGLEEQVVLLTHHLDLLAGFDRVLVFDQGRIVADASPDQAIDHYRQLMRTST